MYIFSTPLMTYDEFAETEEDKKYIGKHYKCFMCGASDAEYELGDARWYCAGCDKCAHVPEHYKRYLDAHDYKIEKTKKNKDIDYDKYNF